MYGNTNTQAPAAGKYQVGSDDVFMVDGDVDRQCTEPVEDVLIDFTANDAAYRAEYAKQQAVFVSMGLSETEYVLSRRVDAGMPLIEG